MTKSNAIKRLKSIGDIKIDNRNNYNSSAILQKNGLVLECDFDGEVLSVISIDSPKWSHRTYFDNLKQAIEYLNSHQF